LVAINIIGDPADFGDKSNIVSLGYLIPKEDSVLLFGGNHLFSSQKSVILKIFIELTSECI
jgi:hypothetical protein